MRLFLFCGLALAFTSPGQESPSQLKHLTAAPLNARRPVSLEALDVQRGVEYPSVVKLKGNVQIKTPVCLPVGPGNAMVCDGYMIVRADEAEFDEATGKIRPRGNVVVTPLQHEGNRQIHPSLDKVSY